MNDSKNYTEMMVGLGERSYPILAGPNLLDLIGEHAKEVGLHSPIAIITDSNVKDLYAERVLQSLENSGFTARILDFPAGESSKHLQTVSALYDGMVSLGPERKSGVIALGGGVPGDIAGFVAATYLRGMRFIQVPTTLLAQVDSAVGGKVGVDHAGGKNLIGAFHQPCRVTIDTRTLQTLDRRQIKAGLAEIIKHGVIADEALFQRICDILDRLLAVDDTIYQEIIPWNCRIKANVVEQDEKESGLRAILNFGHTIGHALETLTVYEHYLHGEAVAIGMLVEAQLGERLGITPPAVVEALASLLRKADYPLEKPDISADRLLDSMFRDKKVERGRLRFIFPAKMGDVTIQDVEDLDLIRDTWDQYS